MKIALVTGCAGLIGGEAVRFFSEAASLLTPQLSMSCPKECKS
jgi:hypothetical protein